MSLLPFSSPYRPAWLPLTARGVAAFANAPLRWLGAAQCALAAAMAMLVAATVQDTWFAGMRELLTRLPAEAAIRNGRLDWTNAAPARLVDGRYLAVAVDPERTGALGQEADLTLLLGETNAWCASLLGYAELPYPAGYSVSLRRDDLAAWWGAREVFLVAAVGAGVGLLLLLLWWVLASVYWLPVWLLALIAQRDAGPSGAWRVAAAAQLPGLVVLAAALASYRFGWLNLLRLGYGTALSFVVAWVYVLWAPFVLPKAPLRPAKENPFSGAATVPARRPDNPFAR